MDHSFMRKNGKKLGGPMEEKEGHWKMLNCWIRQLNLF